MVTLVTGGTGFIGAAVLRALVANGEANQDPGAIRALWRGDGTPPDPELARLPVSWVTGDVTDPASIDRAVTDCDAIIHVAGRIATRPQDAAICDAVNYGGTINIFEAALRHHVRRVVYTASIFALGIGDPTMPPLDEAAAYQQRAVLDHFRSPYVRSKRRAEATIPKFLDRGLDLVMVYPGFCVGPGDHYLTSSRMIIAYLRGQIPGYLPGGLCQVDVRDAGIAHARALSQGRTGERYLVTGHNVTFQEVFGLLAEIAGRQPPRWRLPLGPLRLAGSVLERVSARPLLDSGVAELLAHSWWYDDSKARREWGLTYRPLATSLADAAQWFADHGIVPAQRMPGLALAAHSAT